MQNNLQERACWLLLVFECGLSISVINTILLEWCKQRKRTLQEFFTAGMDEWRKISFLKPELLQKLDQARARLTAQAFLAEQLEHEHIEMITVLEERYPRLLKQAVGRNKLPPVLFAMGDVSILDRRTVAIIGSRNAHEASLEFTQSVASYLSMQGINVISGNARGVDRAALQGALNSDGYTTVVLPHGIQKLSKVQFKALLPGIEKGKVLLLSQFHPTAPWLVSRAMERNHIVTGLAQLVVVAESDSKGGTWEGANNALRQGRNLYVCKDQRGELLPGNEQLIQRGGHPLLWPDHALDKLLHPLVHESHVVQTRQQSVLLPPNQLSMLALPEM